jgi:hypothetical protein
VPEHSTFDYAILRVVPRVEREEFINVGVLLYCRTRDFLEARTELDRARLAALAPELDVPILEEHLATFERIARGGQDAGPIGRLTQAERFHWLTSPRSTILQTSPVHSGLCASPAEAIERLMERMVRPVRER